MTNPLSESELREIEERLALLADNDYFPGWITPTFQNLIATIRQRDEEIERHYGQPGFPDQPIASDVARLIHTLRVRDQGYSWWRNRALTAESRISELEKERNHWLKAHEEADEALSGALAERDRLREALERIAAGHDGHESGPCAIAREALSTASNQPEGPSG